MVSQKFDSSSTPDRNALRLLPPEIRSEIFTYHLLDHFKSSPFRREIIYQATDTHLWNQEASFNLGASELPPLERALVGDRRLHREIFSIRISMSALVIRPAEYSYRNNLDILDSALRNMRRKIRYPTLGRHISPLVIRCAREVRYLT